MDEKRKAELRLCSCTHGPTMAWEAWKALPELLDDNDAKDREIERLNAELEEYKHGYIRKDGKLAENQIAIQSLTAQLAAVTSERDAAVDDMQLLVQYEKPCALCNNKYCTEHDNDDDALCCPTNEKDNHWEWHGSHPKGETE